MASLFDLQTGIDTYLAKRAEQGSFVTACLENNLYDAATYADGDSMAHIRELMQYIRGNVPVIAWGSRDNVEAYLHPKDEDCD